MAAAERGFVEFWHGCTVFFKLVDGILLRVLDQVQGFPSNATLFQ
jgi:hypothetical protein